LHSTKQGYHQRIAQVLEERFPETVENQPELLAYHFTEAGLNEQAVGYWQQAGEKAVQRSANAEAITYLNQGLKVLKTLPDTTQRAQRELTLLMTLGQPLINMKSTAAPEVEQTFHRAQVLSQQVGTTSDTFRVLNALRSFYLNCGELEAARELNAHMLRIAQDLQEPLSLLNAHAAFGHTLVHLGEFKTAQTHLEQGLTVNAFRYPRSPLPLSTSGQDLETFSLSWLACTLWFLGYPEQAVQRSNEALALAQAREHLFNLVNTFNYCIRLHRWRGERQIVEERLEASMTLSIEYGFAQQAAIGKIERGFVLTEHGNSKEGLTLMHQGLAAYRATGVVARQPWYLAELAEAHGKVGQAEEGLTALTEALALVHRTNERWYEAELHRLNGVLLLQQSPDNATEAEACFQKAIAIAQNQSAKSWELRAATSLARLWQSQGNRDEARELLAPVYEWFTEGFDTADLIDAKALLDELS
jgi:predicted ATPase